MADRPNEERKSEKVHCNYDLLSNPQVFFKIKQSDIICMVFSEYIINSMKDRSKYLWKGVRIGVDVKR